MYKTHYMFKKSISGIASLLFVLILVHTESNAQKVKSGEKGKINPTFSYSPPQRDSIASTGLTIAILKPVFMDETMNKFGSPWTDFSKKMAEDVEALLTAKGFRVRGPFTTVDEMVFGDKQSSDFMMQIVIDLGIKDDKQVKTGLNLLGSTLSYKITKGDVSINSNVILTAVSCFTNEKIWKKNLTMSMKNFTYEGSLKWTAEPDFLVEFQNDVNLWNPMCRQLVEIYKDSFDILYRQFDKNEMANIAREARKSDGVKRSQ